MALDNSHKSKQTKRSKTKEVLAVAGLTAAEYSSSYDVQDYLGKTIQSASQHTKTCPDTSRSVTKLQKPSMRQQNSLSHVVNRSPSKLRSPSRGEQTYPGRHSSPTIAGCRQHQQLRAHWHPQIYHKAAHSSEELKQQQYQHASLGRLSLAEEPSSVYRQQQPYRMPVPAALVAGRDSEAGTEEEERQQQYAMLVSLQRVDKQQTARRINRDKLGRQEEALGSHPPLALLEDRSDDGTGTEVPSGSTCSE